MNALTQDVFEHGYPVITSPEEAAKLGFDIVALAHAYSCEAKKLTSLSLSQWQQLAELQFETQAKLTGAMMTWQFHKVPAIWLSARNEANQVIMGQDTADVIALMEADIFAKTTGVPMAA